jgi:predicted transcriptional regulator
MPGATAMSEKRKRSSKNAYYERFAWALALKKAYALSAGAYEVLTALLVHAHKDTGICWPTEASLADRLGRAERTVQRGVRELRTKGVIAVEEDGRRNNQYRFLRWGTPADVIAQGPQHPAPAPQVAPAGPFPARTGSATGRDLSTTSDTFVATPVGPDGHGGRTPDKPVAPTDPGSKTDTPGTDTYTTDASTKAPSRTDAPTREASTTPSRPQQVPRINLTSPKCTGDQDASVPHPEHRVPGTGKDAAQKGVPPEREDAGDNENGPCVPATATERSRGSAGEPSHLKMFRRLVHPGQIYLTSLIMDGRRLGIAEQEVRKFLADEGLPIIQLSLGQLDESLSQLRQVVDVPENWTGVR